jgi:hypothetical protein
MIYIKHLFAFIGLVFTKRVILGTKTIYNSIYITIYQRII